MLSLNHSAEMQANLNKEAKRLDGLHRDFVLSSITDMQSFKELVRE